MTNPLVGVVLGSRTDFHAMRRGLEHLRSMGVPYVIEFSTPHGAPDRLAQFARTAGDRGIEVLVCAAAGTPQVAGALAAHTNLPVVAVPIDTTTNGTPHLLASLAEQPNGVPVACMGINAAENACLFAVQVLALKYSRYREALARARMTLGQKMDASIKELSSEFPDLCRPERTSPPNLRPRESEVETDPNPEDEKETLPPAERPDPLIRPGATMVQRTSASGTVRVADLGNLLSTPKPVEPGAITEEAGIETEGDTDGDEDDATRTPPEELPPPPSDDEFTLPLHVRHPHPADAPLRGTDTGRVRRLQKDLDKALHVIDTKRFHINPDAPDQDILSHAMMVILEGGIAAFPTDTVYGLAVDATNPDAVRRLYQVKGYSAASKSLSVLVHNQDLIDRLVKEVPPPIESVLEAYWPGGLTVIFAKHPTVLSSVTESPSIAIRIPKDPVALTLMSMVGRPFAVINAAIRDYPAAVSGEEVMKRFDTKIECLLDAGSCRSGQPSTVLSVIAEPYEVLREGAVPLRDLKKMLGNRLKD